MFNIFARFADWGVNLLGVSKTTSFGSSVHFFLEDFTKIVVLIYVLIFTVSLFRSQLSAEKVKAYLSGKSRWYGYVLAVVLGIVTPFCSCSSIPLFVGFLAAGIPFGVTMAFLISSPLVSEIAAVLLIGTPKAGLAAAGIYVLSGCLISVLGGYLCDRFQLVRWIQQNSFLPEKKDISRRCCCCGKVRKSKIYRIKELLLYSHTYAWNTLSELFWYILAGLILGAFIHGYIPQEFFAEWLGRENWYAVPLASVAGAPLYASHAGVIPVIQSLLGKGVPLGTALVLLMSITALSLPEMIMLNRVLKWKLIGWFCAFLIVSFIITGYLLNMLI